MLPCQWRGFDWLIINRPLREIQNYTNGWKRKKNIRFEIKKIIDSREWIPKEWKENSRKYSGQIQKFQIQMVKIVCSK
jgi:hypothetical protein